MPKNRVPVVVKHMTIAILKKGGIDGDTEEAQFISAWNIARFRLAQYGHLTPESEKGPPSNIKLTSKGKKLETKHLREGGRPQKENLFDRLFEAIDEEDLLGRD